MNQDDRINEELIRNLFYSAFGVFLDKEAQNIIDGVSEMGLCGGLSKHIENEAKNLGLNDYHSDVEYNRKQDGQLKTIINDKMEVINIRCDLILHSRGASIAQDNLLAIEMKKSNRPMAEKNDDRERLKALTKTSFDDIWSKDGVAHPEHVCGYLLGVYLELDTVKNIFRVEEYAEGRLLKKYDSASLV